MAKLKKHYGCPVELAVEALGGKWKTVVLARLKEQPHRYGELRRQIPRLSDKVLTERLNDLESLGFIERIRNRNSQEVFYQLTEQGKMAQPVLEALYEWGEKLGNQLSIQIGD